MLVYRSSSGLWVKDCSQSLHSFSYIKVLEPEPRFPGSQALEGALPLLGELLALGPGTEAGVGCLHLLVLGPKQGDSVPG
jgi:hypothetical protein